MPRKYKKRSDYWDKFKKEPNDNLGDLINQAGDLVEPKFCGESFYASGSYSRSQPLSGSSGALSRTNKIFNNTKTKRYSNLVEGLSPFESNNNSVSVKGAIDLCQKTYCNVAIFRNAIDVMSEFANSEIHLEGGTAPAREFIAKWLERVKIWNLKDQYFREYYRSGNVFFYRVDGKLDRDDLKKITSIYGEAGKLSPGTVPIRYILLNPYDIVATKTTSFEDGDYKKMLSTYELDRLRNPKTKEDQALFDSLPKETQRDIKKKRFTDEGVYIPLDTEKLSYSFYKKQDYEPFAVPFGFPVLDDINWKLELKKIDQAISRTVENVILLITMGAAPDKGGINPTNLNAMQALFQNESVGRVLVSDYTTEANFIIPDIDKVLGSEKYKIVNEDIREGLQNIVVGQEKYANTQVKAQMFLERLKESRNAFINDFLQPQIKLICRNMGFRKFPNAKFESIDIKDEVQLQRVATRLIELGVLTPEDGLKTIQTGVYPSDEDLEPNQEEYAKQRKKGLYNPLVGGVPFVEPPGADKERKLKEKVSKDTARTMSQNQPAPNEQPAKPKQEAGRPSGATAAYSRKNIQETIYNIEKLRNSLASALRKKIKKKKLSKEQADTVDRLVESVVESSEGHEWNEVGLACVREFNNIEGLRPMEEISEISIAHELAAYPSAILYHSKKEIIK
jgi:hypothetical protein